MNSRRKLNTLAILCFRGENHSKAYEDLKKKIEAKLHRWKTKLLLQAGKCILIKSVINSMPIYAMSAFKFLSKWCKHMKL